MTLCWFTLQLIDLKFESESSLVQSAAAVALSCALLAPMQPASDAGPLAAALGMLVHPTCSHHAALRAPSTTFLLAADGCPLRRMTLHIASTLFDGLRPAALFGGLDGALKELVLDLAPDMDAHTCGRLFGVPEIRALGLSYSSCGPSLSSDRSLHSYCIYVSLQAL
ncbi:hypothetical protein EDB89DRAFT_2011916 [Lactarius sanguifluus]|nr:hypothetical protein EDB89DRAFT_2011916 [Lactarius sanguifluus]